MKHWYHKGLGALLLLPLSALFFLLSAIQRVLYRTGILKPYRSPVPVVVIGNISVGGTGKTPLLIACVSRLRKAGFKVGVVSRGYKSEAENYPVIVNESTPASVCGDEPKLIKLKTGVDVVVDPVRSRAAKVLVEKGCDVILSDDGMQHYALARDIEICVVDGQRGLGNGWLLPAGPLRESKGRLNRCDFVVTNGVAGSRFGQSETMSLVPGALFALSCQQILDLSWLTGQKVHAVAGIGNPPRFFETLRQLGAEVVEHPFGDHHAFSLQDLPNDGLPVVMTEKDAVKCKEFAESHHYVLSVDCQLEESFLTALTARCLDLKKQRE